MVLNIFTSYSFKNNLTTSASDDDAMKLRTILHTAWRGLFIGGVSVGGKFGLFDGELK